VLAAIARIVKGEAAAAGAPREPTVEIVESSDALMNDPALTERLRRVFEGTFGKDAVLHHEAARGSEDFSAYTSAGVPGVYWVLGGADPKARAQAKASGATLPSNHSPFFAPVDPALVTGIASEIAAVRYALSLRPEELRAASRPPGE
jgi:hippurate hydrolase